MTANPTSPSAIFSSLHRRSRLSDATVKENREAAVREAKQHVRDVVRNDWSYDPPSSLFASGPLSPVTSASSTIAPTTSSSAPCSAEVQREAVVWRLREYASSGSELEPEGACAMPSRGRGSRDRDPYRFENPDVIKSAVTERRRKRRAELEDEMRWNSGLRFFMDRRDAWTGARKRRVIRAPSGPKLGEPAKIPDTLSGSSVSPGHISGASGSVANGSHAPSDATVRTETETSYQTKEESSPGSTSSVLPPSELLEELSISPRSEQGFVTENGGDSDDSIVPVMEPFLPDSNSIRSSITPAIYASIYSKVIVQGLTPTVPINLADVTKAMVAGWKADGQWPPKPSIPVPGSDVPVRKKSHQAQAQNETANGKLGRKGSLSGHGSGVTNAVKKVLGLSNHSFHLRRSSRSGDTVEPEGVSGEANGMVGGERAITEVPVVEESGRHY
jgi:hypothetical protein